MSISKQRAVFSVALIVLATVFITLAAVYGPNEPVVQIEFGADID